MPSGVQINSDGKKIGKQMWVNAGKKLQAVGSFTKEIFSIKMQSKIDTYKAWKNMKDPKILGCSKISFQKSLCRITELFFSTEAKNAAI